MNFSNKKVLITGATSGIGRATAEIIREMNGEVHITGKRQHFDCDFFHSVDFSDDSSLNNFLEKIENTSFDVLINNAGINKIDFLSDLKILDYEKIMKVNATTPLILMNHVARKMKKNEYGRIVNVSSIYGNISKEKRISYSSSKFALKGLTKSISLEMAEHNILVNSVSPGFTKTELTKRILSESEIYYLESQIPIGRLAEPFEISNLICFLASDLNSYISGQDFIIDGGYCCG